MEEDDRKVPPRREKTECTDYDGELEIERFRHYASSLLYPDMLRTASRAASGLPGGCSNPPFVSRLGNEGYLSSHTSCILQGL
ncbi:MAG: hypothetical protein KKH04_00830 [Proteobacteria bacterium]|nr:hypothetical protein [Pseudomonadota bacterium]